MLKVYLGCDLFTEGQRWQANQVENMIKEKMGNDVDIYNPASNMDINDKSQFSYGYDILMADYERLKEADILIALMDTEDTGLAAEMGMAWILDIPIYQLYTDIRLDGADNEVAFREMAKDPFQMEVRYYNKLVTGLSYVWSNGEKHYPTIFREKEELVEYMVEHYEYRFKDN